MTSALQQLVNIARNVTKSEKTRIHLQNWCKVNIGTDIPLPASPVKNRWNSFCLAIERYLEIHTYLQQYVASNAAEDNEADVLVANVLSQE